MEKIFIDAADMGQRRGGLVAKSINNQFLNRPESFPPLARIPGVGGGKKRRLIWHIEDVLAWEKSCRALPDPGEPAPVSSPSGTVRRGRGTTVEREQAKRLGVDVAELRRREAARTPAVKEGGRV